MANDNNNLKELVSGDQDRTAGLESRTWQDSHAEEAARAEFDVDLNPMEFDPYVAPIRNRDAVIQDLKADLRIKTETIDRLQFDVERLRSRRIGLETEVKARSADTQAHESRRGGKQADRHPDGRAQRGEEGLRQRLGPPCRLPCSA